MYFSFYKDYSHNARVIVVLHSLYIRAVTLYIWAGLHSYAHIDHWPSPLCIIWQCFCWCCSSSILVLLNHVAYSSDDIEAAMAFLYSDMVITYYSSLYFVLNEVSEWPKKILQNLYYAHNVLFILRSLKASFFNTLTNEHIYTLSCQPC